MDARNQAVRGEEGENSGALRENKARGLGRFSLLLLKYRAVVASPSSRFPHLIHARCLDLTTPESCSNTILANGYGT